MWSNFIYFSIVALACWIIATLYAYRRGRTAIVGGIYLLGSFAIAAFIVMLWISLDRPPLRTLGETRLWYAFFVPLVGAIIYLRWKFRWILSYTSLLALVFIVINIVKPETHSKALMPALQSIWFVPHVVVYIFSYALLGAASLVAAKILFKQRIGQPYAGDLLTVADTLVYVGFSFLTMGLVFGALWAKEAWGHYWTWDPKETWAFITWLGYLVYLHLRYHTPQKQTTATWMLALAFVVLLVCWFGINYLPAAQNSVHTYSR